MKINLLIVLLILFVVGCSDSNDPSLRFKLSSKSNELIEFIRLTEKVCRDRNLRDIEIVSSEKSEKESLEIQAGMLLGVEMSDENFNPLREKDVDFFRESNIYYSFFDVFRVTFMNKGRFVLYSDNGFSDYDLKKNEELLLLDGGRALLFSFSGEANLRPSKKMAGKEQE